jgi:hypothetical protein
MPSHSADTSYYRTMAGYDNLARDFSESLIDDATLAASPVNATTRFATHWRRDSNLVLSNIERCSVDSPGTCDHRAVLLELTHRAVTLVPKMRKPFDVLVEGLLVQSSRGDWI